ncbi:hypothetical protein Lfu02_74460 [Longispora fulva]|uniref:Acyl carrier protein n=1 Tax=Longispora fulva TaxID=619741 RepID=A0A8J7G7J9_9ACTN|nr:acyl carrier protein [Longispora fulva]MBG6134365.1 acyl carrier protein [Longispora fulva]GIG63074.1 hypothetical protein Lfu02_74460 [Longispora fulva]
MSTQQFSMDDLMTVLVTRVGLPQQEVTDDPRLTFGDVGLDSLAFLHIQGQLKASYGVDLPVDRPLTYTFGEILDSVNGHLARVEERVS